MNKLLNAQIRIALCEALCAQAKEMKLDRPMGQSWKNLVNDPFGPLDIKHLTSQGVA